MVWEWVFCCGLVIVIGLTSRYEPKSHILIRPFWDSLCVCVCVYGRVCLWAYVCLHVCGLKSVNRDIILSPSPYTTPPKKSTISLSQAILWLEVTVRYAVLCQEPQTHGQFLAETQHLVKVIARSILYLYLPSLMEVSILAMEQLYWKEF